MPRDFATGVFDAIAAAELCPAAIVSLVHGTTVMINAITQRRGVTTALVTTAGFRDALEIGRGNRPDMYNLTYHKPAPVVPRRRRFEVREQVAADGTIRESLMTADLDAVVTACQAQGVETVAVCFLHAYAHPQHEAMAATFLRERLPGVAVTASSEITKEWREYERASTTVLNAYVQPILDRYLGDLEARLRADAVTGALTAMLSNGGTGGGGDSYIGKLMAQGVMERRGPVTLLGVEELADDDLVIPSAMMVAPTVMVEKIPRGEEIVTAVKALEIVFQNEFLIPRGGNEFLVTTPDLITVLDAETGEPITTESLRYGFRVVVSAMPCDPRWRTADGLKLVGPRYFHYDVPYSPVEDRFGKAARCNSSPVEPSLARWRQGRGPVR